MIFHDNIFDDIIDKLHFLNFETVSEDLIRLAANNWSLVGFLEQTVELNGIIWLSADNFYIYLLLGHHDCKLIDAEFIFCFEDYLQNCDGINQTFVGIIITSMVTLCGEVDMLSFFVHTH